MVILKNVNRHMGTAAIFMVNRAKMVLMEKWNIEQYVTDMVKCPYFKCLIQVTVVISPTIILMEMP